MSFRALCILFGAIVAAVILYFAVGFFTDVQSRSADLDQSVATARAALDRGDFAAAMQACADGLARHPDDVDLEFMRVEGFIGRKRYSDAIDQLDRLKERSLDSDREDDARVLAAIAHGLRFVDAGDRGDFNLAESDLRSAGDSEFAADAAVALGLALERTGDEKVKDEAARLEATPGARLVVR